MSKYWVCHKCGGRLSTEDDGEYCVNCGWRPIKTSIEQPGYNVTLSKHPNEGCEFHDDCFTCPYDRCFFDLTRTQMRQFRRDYEAGKLDKWLAEYGGE